MMRPNDAQVRDRLEALYQRSSSVSFWKQMGEFLQQIGTAIVVELTRDRTAPRIAKFYTVEGKALWRIFDPVSHQQLILRSEAEVDAWLAKQYAD